MGLLPSARYIDLENGVGITGDAGIVSATVFDPAPVIRRAQLPPLRMMATACHLDRMNSQSSEALDTRRPCHTLDGFAVFRGRILSTIDCHIATCQRRGPARGHAGRSYTWVSPPLAGCSKSRFSHPPYPGAPRRAVHQAAFSCRLEAQRIEFEPLGYRNHWRGLSVRQDPMQRRTAHTKCGTYLLAFSLTAAGFFEHPEPALTSAPYGRFHRNSLDKSSFSAASVVRPTLLYIWRFWSGCVPQMPSRRTRVDSGCDGPGSL